jgi:hypothetical protein
MSTSQLTEEDARILATRLCIELVSLTALPDSSVSFEVLGQRLRAGPTELAAALDYAFGRGWISRTNDGACADPGREWAIRCRPPNRA